MLNYSKQKKNIRKTVLSKDSATNFTISYGNYFLDIMIRNSRNLFDENKSF